MKTVFFIIGLFYAFYVQAQSVTPTVLNCGSVDVKAGKVRYSFVIGQSFVAVSSSATKSKATLSQDGSVLGQLYASPVKKTATVAQSKINVKLYPNPAADHVKISISNKAESQTYQAQMLDLLGRIVAEKQNSDPDVQDETLEFDVSGFPPGQYLFRIFALNDIQNAQVFKLVKVPN